MNLVNLYSIFCLSCLFIWHLSVDMLKTCRTARPFILGHHFAPTAWDVKNLWGLALLLFGVSNGAWRFMYALSILPLLGVGYVRRHLPETRCTADFSCQGENLATWEDLQEVRSVQKAGGCVCNPCAFMHLWRRWSSLKDASNSRVPLEREMEGMQLPPRSIGSPVSDEDPTGWMKTWRYGRPIVPPVTP